MSFFFGCNFTPIAVRISFTLLQVLSILFLSACFFEILHNGRNITPKLCATFVTAALLGSALMTVLPSLSNGYGSLLMWCWIDDPALQWACVT